MQRKITKLISLLLCFLLICQQSGFAQVAGQLDISGYIGGLRNSLFPDKFRPLHLRYLNYNPELNNFRLLLDKGDIKDLKNSFVESSSKTLLSYFFVGISLPNEAFWVNLRPDTEDKIIDNDLGKTDVGKILLEADLQLKKDTAQFTSPETSEGREYWDKLYKKAGEIFGSSNITIPTLTRPWIVPDEIIIRETKDSAYVYKATLKVMLEQDYLKDSATYDFKDERFKELNEYSAGLIRELIIPKLNKEINSSKRYAALRQVFYSLILAQWFKARFSGKSGLYCWLIDKRNLEGLTSKEKWSKNTIFQEYKKSFQQGEYNIKEPVSTSSGQTIRSYFSGGIVPVISMPPMPGPGEIASSPIKETGGRVDCIGSSSPANLNSDKNQEVVIGLPDGAEGNSRFAIAFDRDSLKARVEMSQALQLASQSQRIGDQVLSGGLTEGEAYDLLFNPPAALDVAQSGEETIDRVDEARRKMSESLERARQRMLGFLKGSSPAAEPAVRGEIIADTDGQHIRIEMAPGLWYRSMDPVRTDNPNNILDKLITEIKTALQQGHNLDVWGFHTTTPGLAYEFVREGLNREETRTVNQHERAHGSFDLYWDELSRQGKTGEFLNRVKDELRAKSLWQTFGAWVLNFHGLSGLGLDGANPQVQELQASLENSILIRKDFKVDSFLDEVRSKLGVETEEKLLYHMLHELYAHSMEVVSNSQRIASRRFIDVVNSVLDEMAILDAYLPVPAEIAQTEKSAVGLAASSPINAGQAIDEKLVLLNSPSTNQGNLRFNRQIANGNKILSAILAFAISIGSSFGQALPNNRHNIQPLIPPTASQSAEAQKRTELSSKIENFLIDYFLPLVQRHNKGEDITTEIAKQAQEKAAEIAPELRKALEETVKRFNPEEGLAYTTTEVDIWSKVNSSFLMRHGLYMAISKEKEKTLINLYRVHPPTVFKIDGKTMEISFVDEIEENDTFTTRWAGFYDGDKAFIKTKRIHNLAQRAWAIATSKSTIVDGVSVNALNAERKILNNLVVEAFQGMTKEQIENVLTTIAILHELAHRRNQIIGLEHRITDTVIAGRLNYIEKELSQPDRGSAMYSIANELFAYVGQLSNMPNKNTKYGLFQLFVNRENLAAQESIFVNNPIAHTGWASEMIIEWMLKDLGFDETNFTEEEIWDAQIRFLAGRSAEELNASCKRLEKILAGGKTIPSLNLESEKPAKSESASSPAASSPLDEPARATEDDLRRILDKAGNGVPLSYEESDIFNETNEALFTEGNLAYLIDKFRSADIGHHLDIGYSVKEFGRVGKMAFTGRNLARLIGLLTNEYDFSITYAMEVFYEVNKEAFTESNFVLLLDKLDEGMHITEAVSIFAQANNAVFTKDNFAYLLNKLENEDGLIREEVIKVMAEFAKVNRAVFTGDILASLLDKLKNTHDVIRTDIINSIVQFIKANRAVLEVIKQTLPSCYNLISNFEIADLTLRVKNFSQSMPIPISSAAAVLIAFEARVAGVVQEDGGVDEVWLKNAINYWHNVENSHRLLPTIGCKIHLYRRDGSTKYSEDELKVFQDVADKLFMALGAGFGASDPLLFAPSEKEELEIVFAPSFSHEIITELLYYMMDSGLLDRTRYEVETQLTFEGNLTDEAKYISFVLLASRFFEKAYLEDLYSQMGDESSILISGGGVLRDLRNSQGNNFDNRGRQRTDYLGLLLPYYDMGEQDPIFKLSNRDLALGSEQFNNAWGKLTRDVQLLNLALKEYIKADSDPTKNRKLAGVYNLFKGETRELARRFGMEATFEPVWLGEYGRNRGVKLWSQLYPHLARLHQTKMHNPEFQPTFAQLFNKAADWVEQVVTEIETSPGQGQEASSPIDNQTSSSSPASESQEDFNKLEQLRFGDTKTQYTSYLNRYYKDKKDQWPWLRGNFIPAMINRAIATGEKSIRVLVLGASTGEENARAFHEIVTGLAAKVEDPHSWDIRIVGVERNHNNAVRANSNLSGKTAFFYVGSLEYPDYSDGYAYAQSVLKTLRQYREKINEQTLCVKEGNIADVEFLKSLGEQDLILANITLGYLSDDEWEGKNKWQGQGFKKYQQYVLNLKRKPWIGVAPAGNYFFDKEDAEIQDSLKKHYEIKVDPKEVKDKFYIPLSETASSPLSDKIQQDAPRLIRDFVDRAIGRIQVNRGVFRVTVASLEKMWQDFAVNPEARKAVIDGLCKLVLVAPDEHSALLIADFASKHYKGNGAIAAQPFLEDKEFAMLSATLFSSRKYDPVAINKALRPNGYFHEPIIASSPVTINEELREKPILLAELSSVIPSRAARIAALDRSHGQLSDEKLVAVGNLGLSYDAANFPEGLLLRESVASRLRDLDRQLRQDKVFYLHITDGLRTLEEQQSKIDKWLTKYTPINLGSLVSNKAILPRIIEKAIEFDALARTKWRELGDAGEDVARKREIILSAIDAPIESFLRDEGFFGEGLAKIKLVLENLIVDSNKLFSDPDNTAPHLSGAAFDVEFRHTSDNQPLKFKYNDIVGQIIREPYLLRGRYDESSYQREMRSKQNPNDEEKLKAMISAISDARLKGEAERILAVVSDPGFAQIEEYFALNPRGPPAGCETLQPLYNAVKEILGNRRIYYHIFSKDFHHSLETHHWNGLKDKTNAAGAAMHGGPVYYDAISPTPDNIASSPAEASSPASPSYSDGLEIRDDGVAFLNGKPLEKLGGGGVNLVYALPDGKSVLRVRRGPGQRSNLEYWAFCARKGISPSVQESGFIANDTQGHFFIVADKIDGKTLLEIGRLNAKQLSAVIALFDRMLDPTDGLAHMVDLRPDQIMLTGSERDGYRAWIVDADMVHFYERTAEELAKTIYERISDPQDIHAWTRDIGCDQEILDYFRNKAHISSSSPVTPKDTKGGIDGLTPRQEKIGGVDFRALPIMIQPVKTPVTNPISRPISRANVNLDKEWSEIQNMLNGGIIPSSERIKEYLEACVNSDKCDEGMQKALSGIADILRLEEERVLSTEPALRDLLVLLESDKTPVEIQTALANIEVSAQEPLTVE